jgi:ABC-2 type transport system permease protein
VPAELAQSLAAGGGPEPTVSYLYGGPEFDPLDYFAPALIPTFAFLFVFLLTSVGFLRERTQGTFERLMASPLSRLELVFGYMIGFGLFALMQSAIILLFAVFVLRIDYAGNLGIVFLVEAVLTILAVNLGVLLSGFARNEFQAVQFMPIVFIPQILLAGVFWPVNDLPTWLRATAHTLPLTYANQALREVMIKGAGLQSSIVLTDLLVLVGFAVLFLGLGAAALRRQSA